ncbi:MAG: FKBP-type peptidyl-prolyl cis-trans isomerase [Lachnospiraceae bacterium]|nr:FKBP-type peptidyl-prolyl cis-trans isomerase [Lachnospiraceae bacterium]
MSEISKSKQKRMDQQHQRSVQHRQKAAATFWKIAIPLVIVGAIVAGIYFYQLSKLDYSRYLNDNGSIKGVKASDYVTVNDENISFSKAELLPDDSQIDSDIDSDLSSHQVLSEDAGLLSSYGDKLSITYTSTMDGAAYKNAEDPTDYTIGDGTFSSDFDDALQDRAPGEDFTVSVTFDDDYEDADAAGKTAEFNVHVAGIYQDPEFDDAYVQQYHSDVASTTEEYRQSLIDKHYEDNLSSKVEESLSQNSVVSKYPSAYLDNLSRVIADQERNYMIQMYQMFGMTAPSGETWEIMGAASEEEFKATTAAQAKEEVEKSLEIQYLFDKYGLSTSDADVRSYYINENGFTDESFDEAVKANGKGFYAQQYMKKIVLDKLKEVVKITE